MNMKELDLIKLEALTESIDATNAAATEALTSADVNADYISYEVGVLPDSTGATEGTIGAYFTDSGLLQKLEWNGTAWIEIGERISTEKYVDDKASLSLGVGLPFTSFLPENLTVNIPTDFATIQSAIDNLSGFRVKQGVTITLNLESGFTINSTTNITNCNLDHLIISSEDPVVNFTGTTGDLLYSERSRLPVWDILVDMQGNGSMGLLLQNMSEITVMPGKGVINAGTTGLYAQLGSTAYADGSIFTGAGTFGIGAHRISNVSADSSDVSGAGERGYHASSVSKINAEGGKANNCGIFAVYARLQSGIDFTLGEANNAGTVAIYALSNSNISANKAEAKNSGRDGIMAYEGSTISAGEADVSGAQNYGVYAFGGSTVEFVDGIANGCKERGIYALRASNIDAGRAMASNTGVGYDALSPSGVEAREGSNINFKDGTCENTTGNDISVSFGSHISCRGARTTNGTPNRFDTNNDFFNEIVSDRGVIYAIDNPDA